MPLLDHHLRTVVFMLAEQGAGWTVVGTGFVVRWPEMVDGAQVFFYYVVTCKHCVENSYKIGIRVVARDEPHDYETPASGWFYHATEDVAVALMPRAVSPKTGWVQDDEFLDAAPGPFAGRQAEIGALTQPGDRVYFCGLLTGLPTMAERVIPMVRSGTLGTHGLPGVRLEFEDGTVYKPQVAHLVDCRSYQGFSGSPCFLQWDHTIIMEAEAPPRSRLASTTALLGMVIAHFEGNGHREHTGVGVVLPSETIREIFMRKDVSEDRRKRARHAMADQKRGQPKAVHDAIIEIQPFTRDDTSGTSD